VETPGWETFAKLLFDRMHYGVDTNVAALALVLLAGIGMVFFAVLIVNQSLERKSEPGALATGSDVQTRR